jgi:hypothetical protein
MVAAVPYLFWFAVILAGEETVGTKIVARTPSSLAA